MQYIILNVGTGSIVKLPLRWPAEMANTTLLHSTFVSPASGVQMGRPVQHSIDPIRPSTTN